MAEEDASAIAPFGYSEEKISFALILSKDGQFAGYRDLRETSGRKLIPQLLPVPRPIKRTVTIAPNFLWDKTSYALGIEREPDERTRREHEAFKALHLDALAGIDDEGLRTLLTFLEQDAALPSGWLPDELLGSNLVFQLDGERRYLHQGCAARAL